MIEVINVNGYMDYILNKINEITFNEFKLGGYNNEELNIKIDTKDISKRDCIETNMIRGKLNKKCYEDIKKAELHGKVLTQVQTIHDNDIDILSSSGYEIFNIIKDKSKLILWKDLDIEIKIKHLNEYIIKKYEIFPEELLNNLVDLINKNKINFKKYIIYDAILEKITDMPIIEFNNNNYKINYSSEKKIKKKKISLK
jgi:hypothetical protein